MRQGGALAGESVEGDGGEGAAGVLVHLVEEALEAAGGEVRARLDWGARRGPAAIYRL